MRHKQVNQVTQEIYGHARIMSVYYNFSVYFYLQIRESYPLLYALLSKAKLKYLCEIFSYQYVILNVLHVYV